MAFYSKVSFSVNIDPNYTTLGHGDLSHPKNTKTFFAKFGQHAVAKFRKCVRNIFLKTPKKSFRVYLAIKLVDLVDNFCVSHLRLDKHTC